MAKVLAPTRTIQWPPVVLSVTALGHIRDASGNHYPRDIGRSSVLSTGQVLFQFGDTFCHNLSRQFLTVSNNTCSVVPSRAAPTVTKYLNHYGASNQIDRFNGESPVTNLVEKSRDEQNTAAVRWKIWTFSGVVESGRRCEGGEARGWTFFEMWKDHLKGGPTDVYQYTGIAEVTYSEKQISARISNGIAGRREIFSMNEPRFGSFCILSDENWLYAYGHLGGYSSSNPKDVVLARVPLAHADNRSLYTYWNGRDFSPHFQTLAPILKDMQHGQIFQTTMFGTSSIYRYAFIGNNARGDSKVQMGRAAEPWGPWEVRELDVELYALNGRENKGMFDFRYCVYPHPWAGELGKGDLMISWSEGGMTGGVLGAMARLATAP